MSNRFPKLRKAWLDHSLAMRFAVWVLAIGLAASLVITSLSAWDWQRHEENEALQRATRLAGILRATAEQTSAMPQLAQVSELQEVINRTTANSNDIMLMMVVGGDPLRVLASSDKKYLNIPLMALPDAEVGDDLREVFETRKQATRYHSRLSAFDLTTPLQTTGDALGKISKVNSAAMIHIDANPSLADVQARSWELLLLQVAMIFVSALVIYVVFQHFVLKPLAAINHAVQQFAEGNPTAQATIYRNDEIGHVANSLNEMTESLARTQTNFRSIFSSAPLSIAINDRNGRFIEVNPAFLEMYGYTEKEIIGRPFLELVHPTEAAYTWGMFERLMAGDLDRYQIEVQSPRKNGDAMLIWVTVSAIRDPKIGLYSVAVIEDITGRKDFRRHSTRQMTHPSKQDKPESTARFPDLYGNPPGQLPTQPTGV